VHAALKPVDAVLEDLSPLLDQSALPVQKEGEALHQPLRVHVLREQLQLHLVVQRHAPA
jgi:hypothetical protein